MIISKYSNGVLEDTININESVDFSVNEGLESIKKVPSGFSKDLTKNGFVKEISSGESYFVDVVNIKVENEDINNPDKYDAKIVKSLKGLAPKIKDIMDNEEPRTVSKATSTIKFNTGSYLDLVSDKYNKRDFHQEDVAGYTFLICRSTSYDDFDEKFFIKYMVYLMA